ncbi:MAG TPA: DNA repair protein RecO [Propionibacteriaceae bacterium]|nr:DNA repair protein RecO [Propionibacteriaceae bacterium]
MPTYRDRAVVLRTHKLGEADRIITALSREHGKVRAVARGVRRTSSRFGGRLEPFSHVDVQFAVGRNLDVVAQVESLQAFGDPLSIDYAAFTVGQVMLETADRIVLDDGEPALQQYRLLVGALRTLCDGTPDGRRPAGMVLDSYLLRALAVAGYAPSLDACARCGTTGPHEWFSPAAGGLVCRDCRPPGTPALDAGTLTHLRALLTGDWPATREVPASVQKRASGLVAAFTQWHLERALRSLPHVEWDFADR